MRTVIADTAKNGLPGEHHFYVSFNTQAEGVEISARMLAQYPKEMTIVLQHQFWDLVVDAEHFEVGLSFGGIPERLCVPFAAMTTVLRSFGAVRPAVRGDAGGRGHLEPRRQRRGLVRRGQGRPPAEHKGTYLPRPSSLRCRPPPEHPPPGDGPDKPGGGGEVVRLDRFRKK